jgi:NADH-quinone oxidoreductase subunit E
VARLNQDNLVRARDLIALYPHKRSALIPALHILQEQEGYLSPDGIEHVAELMDLTPAEVRGTASFYDMFHLEPIGRYLVAVCTNIACMLAGAYELVEHIEGRLGIPPGGTTRDGAFTLEDAECIALCGNAPCLAINWRFFGDMTPALWDKLAEDLVAGRLDAEVPPHGTLGRVRRSVGLAAATVGATTGPTTGGAPSTDRESDGGGTPGAARTGKRGGRQKAPPETGAAGTGTPRVSGTGSHEIQLATARTTGAVSSTLNPGGVQGGAPEP